MPRIKIPRTVIAEIAIGTFSLPPFEDILVAQRSFDATRGWYPRLYPDRLYPDRVQPHELRRRAIVEKHLHLTRWSYRHNSRRIYTSDRFTEISANFPFFPGGLKVDISRANSETAATMHTITNFVRETVA